MESGILPKEWKSAYVMPVFKKGDRYDPGNYRPISLTCNPCKCMEKIIAVELTEFLLDNDIIKPTQHGFLPGRSTVSNLLTCMEEWTKAYDENQPVDVIYLDYEKAFDKVPFERLLMKLEHFGVRGRLLKWISDFLKARRNQVRVEQSFSDVYGVVSGVPQGSVLGPLLFTVYISDLDHHLSSQILFFADDTKIFSNPLSNTNTLIEDLTILEGWAHTWQLKLNENKCTSLHIGLNNPKNNYVLNNVSLKQVEQQRDLGLIMRSDLKWESHIASIVKKANTMLFLIQKAFETKTVNLVAKLYKSHVRPILEYAHSVWNPYYVKDIELLEGVQRRATRIPATLKGSAYEERLRVFGLPTLRERRMRGDLIETFKIIQNHYKVPMYIFHFNINENLRGHSLKLYKERCNKLQRKNFLTNRVVYSWNSLHNETVTAESINNFKNRLDREMENMNASLVHYL